MRGSFMVKKLAAMQPLIKKEIGTIIRESILSLKKPKTGTISSVDKDEAIITFL